MILLALYLLRPMHTCGLHNYRAPCLPILRIPQTTPRTPNRRILEGVCNNLVGSLSSWDEWVTIETDGGPERFINAGNLHGYKRQRIPSQPKYPAPCRHLDCAPCYRNFRIDTSQTARTADNAGNFDGRHWEEYKHRCC